VKSRAVLAAVGIAVASARGHAQDPQVATPQESIEPDRPDVTNGARLVPAGSVQLEMGGLYTRAGGDRSAFTSPVTARFGITGWLEGRIGGDGIVSTSSDGVRATGFGNTQLAAKIRLLADAAGKPVLSLLPAVNVPTASAAKGLGSGDADYTVALLTGTDLGPWAHVDVNYGAGRIGGGAENRFTQQLISVSGNVSSGAWAPYLEMYWLSKQEATGGAFTALDAGAVYTATPRLAFDGGVQFGLSRAAPDAAVFAGCSVLFGPRSGDSRR
jgi:outer membrane putative beta-barrel porin/alpha-amylase